MIVRDGDKKNEIVSEDGCNIIGKVIYNGIVHIEFVIIICFFILFFLSAIKNNINRDASTPYKTLL